MARLRPAALVLIAMLTGCGDGGPNTPRPPARMLIYQTTFRLPVRDVTVVEFTSPRPGTLIVVVDWTLRTNDLDQALTTTACDFFNRPDSCAALASETSKTAKPSELVYRSGLAQTYRVLIANFGPEGESGVVNVYLES